ncbi:hypothetical protein KGQ90_03755 [Modicisalibacter tunisiensis]|uniref:hypothetical protein n=1 Tax=Modicisalibacter tunisiensis TaxID=390637 RepID=UPI001CCB24F8|nr:hypothetical protein [Modicisalibacter tunisiensis]MBZ9538059.1 hypothetical protein [Modicisalibacter tunisiensis]
MPDNDYAGFLEAAGHRVISLDGIDWYAYRGFMMPAYLPHVMPTIRAASARRMLKQAKLPFARWTEGFSDELESQWWYVIREGPYALEQCSANTRSKIRRGLKRLECRRVSAEEIRQQGYRVCERAISRYTGTAPLIDHAAFIRRVDAAERYPESVEYFGVFNGKYMVGYSENHIQSGAVFWENIWYDPLYLRDYSSYAMTHCMLEYYLEERAMKYVSDGCRSIYHKTNVQYFFIDNFHFAYRFSRLEIMYSPLFHWMVSCAYPFRYVVGSLHDSGVPFFGKVNAILTQESLRRLG